MSEKIMLVKGDPLNLPEGWEILKEENVIQNIHSIILRIADKFADPLQPDVILRVDKGGEIRNVNITEALPEIILNKILEFFNTISQKLADGTLDIR